ncbi:chemotaxis protein CheW [Luteibacter sp. UNCMF366Tsu5.1]|uniref:chemotaxis protein CheW n=1 Tax=Luteibacter sp. UNCMF366Tsu5.1 TaxID=1502758 RepID=UPI00092FFC44|nr:chemotaxis protein CheW [Luteibacter sp. UNCMF366Tsu5.1]
MPSLDLAPGAQANVQLFGTFHLGEFELALPIDVLQEVVSFPSGMTQIPLAPDYVLGLFLLRDMMIPVMDLARFLGQPAVGDQANRRVAIIKADQSLLGVTFDHTGEMLRLASSQIVRFDNGANATGLIAGAFHFDQRIIQVLSAEALVRLPGVPQANSALLALQARQRNALRKVSKVISFHVNGRHMALAMDAIHEIVRVPELEHSVLADSVCRGWFNLRDRPVPVLDVSSFLGLEASSLASPDASDAEDMRRIVVLRDKGFYLGLLVDDIDSIVAHTEAQLLPMPPTRGQIGLFANVISRRDTGEGDLILISTSALFANPYMAHLAKGHHDLYLVTDEEEHSSDARRKTQRETWLTFDLDRPMAVRLDQVCEVIGAHDPLVSPPGSSPYVCGVLNTGHALITVIDLRHVYGMEPFVETEDTRILVVEHAGHKYGLVVDAVRSITSIEPSNKLLVPALIALHLNDELRQDMHEVAEIPGETTLLLLDVASLLRRLAEEGETQNAPDIGMPGTLPAVHDLGAAVAVS